MKMRAQDCHLQIRVPARREGHPGRLHADLSGLLTTLMLILALVGLSSCALTSGSNGHPGATSGGWMASSAKGLSFGNTSVGNAHTQTLTVTNTGTGPINISQVNVSGSGFSVLSGGSESIPAGKSGTIQVQFAPKTKGIITGNLSVVSDASNSPLDVAVSGIGMEAGLTVTPSAVSFGNVTIGQANTQTIRLTNNGDTDAVVSNAIASGNGFTFNGLAIPATIGVNQTVSFTVQFRPVAPGTANGIISFTDNAPASPQVLSLSGAGISSAQILNVNPASLSFGIVNDGNSRSLSVTLTNSGNSNITISGVAVSGAGFSASGIGSGQVLAPTQAATLQVVFAPVGPGSVGGSIQVSSDATNSPSSVSLSGTGAQQSGQSVALNWTASSSSDVTGYNVYRGKTQGSYSRISSSPVSGTVYTDSTVQSGQNITYFYVVTAVNSNNEESANSNVVSALIP